METAAEAFTSLVAVLDRMEIPYLVGGSMASSIHGITRPTMDADIVADLQFEQADEFAALIGPGFYVDASSIKEALSRNRSFNVIHYASSFKIDVFPLRKDEYSRASFARRRYELSNALGAAVECAVATAEDTILRKLEWYRAGGETSERQWNDLRGILMVSGARLDYEYLRKWAPFLKVDDLLESLLAE